MRNMKLLAVAFVVLFPAAVPVQAQSDATRLNAPRVNLVSNIINWRNTLQFGRLVQTSSRFKAMIAPKSRFTVFAIENEGLLPNYSPAVVDRIVARRDAVTADRVIGAHVVAGLLTAEIIAAQIKGGKGRATISTIDGTLLTATQNGGSISLTAPDGRTATVLSANHRSRNGIVHVIDGLLRD